MSWETLSPVCLFWQDPPCIRGHFPCLACWLRKLDLFTSRDPSIRPQKNLASLPYWGPRRGKQTFLPFVRHSTWAFSACLITIKLRANSAKLFNRVDNPQLKSWLCSREQVVSQQRKGEGYWNQTEGGWFQLHQQLSSCQECGMFPKEIPPPPGKQGRKPREFWHISSSGSKHEKEGREGADWSSVSKACEQHGQHGAKFKSYLKTW